MAAAVVLASEGCYRRVVRATGIGNPDGQVWESDLDSDDSDGGRYGPDASTTKGSGRSKKKP